MTSTSLSAVKLEGTEACIRKVLHDLSGRATTVIRAGGGTLYVGIPPTELAWLDKVAKDIGCKKTEVPALPECVKAPCGVHVLPSILRWHLGGCKACVRVRPVKPKKARKQPERTEATEPVVTAKIEPGQSFNLNGIIASIEITRDRLFEKLDYMEKLIALLKGYREASDKLVGLEQEAKDRIQAARKLLNDS